MIERAVLNKEIDRLPPQYFGEVYDFVGYLRSKAQKESLSEDNIAFEGECPICAAHRDPVTGNPRYNAETIAAIEEGRAMMRGEIPSKLYNSLEEMLADLDSDD